MATSAQLAAWVLPRRRKNQLSSAPKKKASAVPTRGPRKKPMASPERSSIWPREGAVEGRIFVEQVEGFHARSRGVRDDGERAGDRGDEKSDDEEDCCRAAASAGEGGAGGGCGCA